MGEGVTYRRVIPPNEFANDCPNLEIENGAATGQRKIFEWYLVGF
jgi:hypothetical protein